MFFVNFQFCVNQVGGLAVRCVRRVGVGVGVGMQRATTSKHIILCPAVVHRLAGLVVKASASGAEDPGIEFYLWRDFSGSSHTSDLTIGTPVATLPGASHYRVSAGTGRPGVTG